MDMHDIINFVKPALKS